MTAANAPVASCWLRPASDFAVELADAEEAVADPVPEAVPEDEATEVELAVELAEDDVDWVVSRSEAFLLPHFSLFVQTC